MNANRVQTGNIAIKMGNVKGDGTDDDVTLTVCDDLNNECCTTPPLDATASGKECGKSHSTHGRKSS